MLFILSAGLNGLTPPPLIRSAICNFCFCFQSLFQTCTIDMAMGSLYLTTVTLVPGQMIMSQKLNMPIFQNVDWNLGKAAFGNGKEGIRMSIVMKRKITSEMMTTYFPSLLLTAITFATTFFKPFFFEAALSVNLTTMLVMTTIFISKMEGLPPTSDIKMIDIWLILCQMVPFVEVVLLTAMEYNRDDSHGEHGTMLMPLNVGDGEDEEKICQNCWTPELKTLGKSYHDFHDDEKILLSEKRVLPLLMFAGLIVYFAIAAMFYFEF